MPKNHDNPRERLERAYDTMVERVQEAMERAKDGGSTLQQALEHGRQTAIDLQELSKDEAQKVAAWVRRDLHDAGEYLARTRSELGDWLHMDMELIEYNLLDLFAKAADQTRVELAQFQERARRADEYHSGEVAAPGTLRCTACDEMLHFKKSGHIPPCPRCHGTVFVRKSRKRV